MSGNERVVFDVMFRKPAISIRYLHRNFRMLVGININHQPSTIIIIIGIDIENKVFMVVSKRRKTITLNETKQEQRLFPKEQHE